LQLLLVEAVLVTVLMLLVAVVAQVLLWLDGSPHLQQ
jgi:hypothetical protein